MYINKTSSLSAAKIRQNAREAPILNPTSSSSQKSFKVITSCLFHFPISFCPNFSFINLLQKYAPIFKTVSDPPSNKNAGILSFETKTSHH